MSVERLNAVELSVVRMESSMESLTTKMVDVADSIGEISKAVTKLAVVDVKISDLDKSIGRVADSNRALSNRVELLHNSHEAKHDATLDNADKNGWRRFMLAISFVVGTFGYLYLDMKAEQSDRKAIVKDINAISKNVTELKGQNILINEKLKTASGHRYYIKLSELETIKEYIDKGK